VRLGFAWEGFLGPNGSFILNIFCQPIELVLKVVISVERLRMNGLHFALRPSVCGKLLASRLSDLHQIWVHTPVLGPSREPEASGKGEFPEHCFCYKTAQSKNLIEII